MKGKKIGGFSIKKQAAKTGGVLLAAIILGTGAWVTDMQVKNQVPELTTFVDVEELVSIGEEEVPLASAPKVTVKTKKSVKVVKLKQKAKKTQVKQKTTKKTKTKKKTTKTELKTTTVETTTLVSEKYKKGSNKKTVQTTKTIKTTVTVMDLAASKGSENSGAGTQSSAAASTQKTQETGVVEISGIAPLVDERIKSAYETLGFTVEVDPKVSYTGYFSAKEQNITLRRNDDTIYHELGHFLAFVAGNVDTKAEFLAVYQEEKNLMEGMRKAYATQNSSEYFAESFREYTLDPVTLQNKRPKTYQSIVDALNAVTSTQTSRILAVYGAFWNSNT